MLNPSAISFLKRLLDAPAPSGFEAVAARAWRTEAETFADKVSADVAGNSIAEVNPGGSPTIMLDGHFVIEQTTRNRSGNFFNFNGTAGIWRRDAI